MKTSKGNIWTFEADWIVITTNGFVKKNGEAVMGAGVALQAKKKFPKLPTALAEHLGEKGNCVGVFEDFGIITMPVKINWWEKARLDLIKKSCIEMSSLPFNETFVVPKPGCGNGKLSWQDVKPICEKYLDDRFTLLV